jgi:hypothetical protein
MARLTIDQFCNFFRYYEDLPHQRLAIAELWKLMPVSLLEDDADWIQTFRDPAIDEDPEVPIVIPGRESENSWGGVLAAARKAGAKFPEVASAQWALESAWGTHTSGENNFFGLKAADGEPYSTCTTWEHSTGKDLTIQARFKDFDSLQDCVDQLVNQWYHDFRGYKGVNRATSVGECCQLLVQEGFATDPNYAAKLMSIINRQAG